MKTKTSKISKICLIYLLAMLLAFAGVPSPAGTDTLFRYEVEQKDFVGSFSFDELVKLSREEEPDSSLRKKLDLILYNPVVQNTTGETPAIKLNNNKVLGDFVRVASWNIGRGINFDTIALVFNEPEKFIQQVKKNEKKPDKDDLEEIEKQVKVLKSTDIFLLNEVDAGMPRTQYRNIAEEFAEMTGYNYAFGVEFVEVDPAHLGLEDYEWSEENVLFPDKEYVVDRSKYRGFHGNAIISRYPLKNVRVIRMPDYYGWFRSERDRVASLEVARRKAASFVFAENVLREIRRGSRIALLADVEIPGQQKPLTVISVHLENRVAPEYRHKQVKYLLEQIREIENPVVLAGDFNTTTKDGRPTDIKREVKKRVTSPGFIAKQAILLAVPYSYAVNALHAVSNVLRTRNNPTVVNIPVVSPNGERKLFNELENMGFADGGRFDFNGEKHRSVNGKRGMLSDSNQRSAKGFVPTYQFNRDMFIGQFKLDWIFVKPCQGSKTDEEDGGSIKKLAPYFGRTLFELNYALNPPLSDHVPITVDLPLNPPHKKQVE